IETVFTFYFMEENHGFTLEKNLYFTHLLIYKFSIFSVNPDILNLLRGLSRVIDRYSLSQCNEPAQRKA
ncbi:hypothetical protein, partial [Vibrio cidicii]|uniref:hypothetical protein n=1 Tax=Vibrio cidicii TaxID=1763883 RepID=UPI001C30D5D0